MNEVTPELMKLVKTHAQLVTNNGPEIQDLADRPDLAKQAIADLERRMRQLFVVDLPQEAKDALFRAVAHGDPELELTQTRRLFGS